MITIIYGLICLLSGDISVDYTILGVTAILDIVWIVAGVLTSKKR